MQAHYGMRDAEYKPAFLYVERGPGAGQLLELKQGVVVVGRASVSDLRIQHPSISRRHAQIKRLGEQFFVKDLSSQNGTFVNKQRLATEIEMKVGDSLALGSALVRLRGPMAKGEKLAPTAAMVPAQVASAKQRHTALVARANAGVTDVRAKPRSANALRIAVLAGTLGFGLAAALAFALVKTMTSQPVSLDKAPPNQPVATAPVLSERERMIQDAITRKMNEPRAAPSQPSDNDDSEPLLMPRADRSAPVVLLPRASAPVVQHTVVASRARSARPDETDDEASATSTAGTKRSQILAPYERGNAEASLELAKKAGDKDLSDKLNKFIQLFDTANEAMVSGNGTLAITNFQKALALDEGLSSGWGKYGGEIRRQLANLYTLVGLQYMSNGDDEKAKKAFEGALKQDPNNTRAKQNLEKLGGTASGDDEVAPASVPATRKVIAGGAKKKPQSIDDAFGD
jgi:pSer/pThr/pTyr-binding forkhead associated (FHA) protein